MRTYNILREKVREFAADEEIQDLLKQIRANATSSQFVINKYDPAQAQHLKNAAFDLNSLSSTGAQYERLDQLVTELLFGVRTALRSERAQRKEAAAAV